MNLLVSLEHRFEATPDGAVWTQTQFPATFWKPYLEVFDNVRVVARVKPVESVGADWRRADDDRVSYVQVPYYIGPWQYLKKRSKVTQVLKNSLREDDAILLRVPSTSGSQIAGWMRDRGKPYAVEVVADPYDVFASGSVRHPLRPFFRWWFTRGLRKVCAAACQASYVTRSALQKRYPCPQGEVAFSDVEISDGALASTPRGERLPGRLKLVFVGTMAQMYKAPDVLIQAVAQCKHDGLDLELSLIGDGQFRGELEALAQRLGIADIVTFRGQLTVGGQVREALDAAHLFVLPSHQEGLPRAMVEAMARALPCIGSTVGGIPELLPPEDLVPPGDALALAQSIRAVATEPGRLVRMSARNLSVAREYHQDRIAPLRRAFYQALCDKTLHWLKGK